MFFSSWWRIYNFHYVLKMYPHFIWKSLFWDLRLTHRIKKMIKKIFAILKIETDPENVANKAKHFKARNSDSKKLSIPMSQKKILRIVKTNTTFLKSSIVYAGIRYRKAWMTLAELSLVHLQLLLVRSGL